MTVIIVIRRTLPPAMKPIFSDDNCVAKLCNSISVTIEAGAFNFRIVKMLTFTDISTLIPVG